MLLPDDLPTSHLHGYVATGSPRKGRLGVRLKERKLSGAQAWDLNGEGRC